MPNYRYKCPECGKEKQEVKLMRQSDDPVYCECGEEMKKIYGIAHFIVRGASTKNGFIGELYKNKHGNVT